MAAAPTSVEVAGLSQFRKALGSLADSATWKSDLARVNLLAARSIIAQALPRAATIGRQAAKAAASMRASNTQAYASIRGGSAAVPFFYGAEFGSIRYQQFKPWRGNALVDVWENGPGYFLFPTIRNTKAETLEFYAKAIEALASRAFPE